MVKQHNHPPQTDTARPRHTDSAPAFGPYHETVRPYTTVRIGNDNDDYDNVCATYGGGSDLLPAWRDLGDLLAYRPGWHFDIVNKGEALWSLGLFGESRLNIHVNDDARYHCFDYGQDASADFGDIPSVEAWLTDREEKAKAPSKTILALVRADDWALLKRHPLRLLVSWSDGYYAASLPHHYDASIAATLKQAVNGAAQMLCTLLRAPVDLAPEVKLIVELDETATERLRTEGA